MSVDNETEYEAELQRELDSIRERISTLESERDSYIETADNITFEASPMEIFTARELSLFMRPF